jgi:hypothetical protein
MAHRGNRSELRLGNGFFLASRLAALVNLLCTDGGWAAH